MQASVAIIVVNWNKCRLLMRLLNSLKNQNYNNYEIFVVDNASTDNSVVNIEKRSEKINLLVNRENLGGTGGFNSGIKFALQAGSFKYVWLLDNDVTVSHNALNALVSIMENNESIGLAGSRILNAQDHNFVVETGAMFDWKAGIVRPVDRNIPKSQSTCTDVVEVDYVAVCSALVRVDALNKVGLMDERYFLFWDDMDWGIAFKQAGYRVVAVPDSEIYHPAFTEYRSVVVDSYYGVRNQLLTFSKYRFYEGACWGLVNLFRRISKGGVLMLLSNKPGGKLVFLGCWDFFRGRWGKIPWPMPETCALKNKKSIKIIEVPQNAKILVIPTHDAVSTAEVVNFLWEKGAMTVDILIPEDRKKLLSGLHYSNLIAVDYFRGSVTLNTWKIFRQLTDSRYDISVKASEDKISPFSYAINASAYYSKDDRVLVDTKESRAQIFQVVFASILGELLGIVLFILAWVRGFFLISKRTYK